MILQSDLIGVGGLGQRIALLLESELLTIDGELLASDVLLVLLEIELLLGKVGLDLRLVDARRALLRRGAGRDEARRRALEVDLPLALGKLELVRLVADLARLLLKLPDCNPRSWPWS